MDQFHRGRTTGLRAFWIVGTAIVLASCGDSSKTEKKAAAPTAPAENIAVNPSIDPDLSWQSQTYVECNAGAMKGGDYRDCAADESKRQDDRLNLSYSTLKAKLSGLDRQSLLESQRTWLRSRDATCGSKVAAEPDGDPDLIKASCLAELSSKRAAELESGNFAQPAASNLPRFNSGESLTLARQRLIEAGYSPLPLRAKADTGQCGPFCSTYPEVIMCITKPADTAGPAMDNYCRFSFSKATSGGLNIVVVATEGLPPRVVDAGLIDSSEVEAIERRRKQFESGK